VSSGFRHTPAHSFLPRFFVLVISLAGPRAGAQAPWKPERITPLEWPETRRRILASMEDVMGKLSDTGSLPPLAPEVVEESRAAGILRYRVTFAATAAERVPAYLLVPDPAPPGPTPAVLALHQTTSIGKAEPAGLGGLSNLQYGAELARRGYVVLCPDYPSFGDYPHDFAADAWPSGTALGIVGHRRAIDFLSARPEVDPRRIGAIGHSLGGHNAIFLAAFDERVRAVVSSCGWTLFGDYKGGNLAGWAGDRYMPRIRDVHGLDPARMPFDFDGVIACIAPRAFLSVSPLDDDNFSARGVRKGIASAAPVYEVLGAKENLKAIYPDYGHDFLFAARLESYAFLDRALLHVPPPSSGELGAELPRVPPLEPGAALAALDIAPGYAVELAAAEPLVTSPVALAFDEESRLHVVEMNDYPYPAPEPLGRVRLLEDAEGDGRFEKSTVFADRLAWPTAVTCWAGGVFVGAAPDILYMKDLDGDGRADERRVVFTGFGRSNVQGLLNGFQWGLDNRIHGSASTCGGKVRRAGEPEGSGIDLSGRSFSFDPRKLDLRAETGGGQHGLAFDDWGRRFLCSNSDHIQLALAEEGDDPGLRPGAPPPVASIALDGPQAEVFRMSPVEPWRLVRTRLRVAGLMSGPVEGGGRASGYFTSATGITIYRGDAWPEGDRGLAIVGDVGSNIVHRKALEPGGLGLSARRVDSRRELLASRSVWFRPVAFANAPDGALLIADMCREVIEHPESLPPEIEKHLDLSSGRDRGRLWRLVPEGFKKPRPWKLRGMSGAELALRLESRNGWVRDTAARLLFEAGDPSARGPLEAIASGSRFAEARVHALHALSGLEALSAGLLLRALDDEHPRVRERAARLARGDAGAFREKLVGLSRDPDARVRREVALGLGRLPPGDAAVEAALTDLLRRDAGEPWTRFTVVSALGPGAVPAFAALASDPDFSGAPGGRQALEDLAGAAGTLDVPARERVVAVMASLPDGPLSRGLLRSFAASAARASRISRRDSLLAGAASAALLDRALERARRDALDMGLAAGDRADAVRFLSLGTFEGCGQTLRGLLDAREPQDVQLAAVTALGSLPERSAVDALLDASDVLSPRFRAAVLGILRAHPDPEARRRAEALARPRAETSGDRAGVVDAYRKALEIEGDPGRGKAIFRKQCGTCHAAGGEGAAVGPSVTAARSRGREGMLLAILDPNREVDPRFVSYAIVTRDGRALTGIIASETGAAVTLRRAEGEEDSISRSEIESTGSDGLSLMPEGVEKEIDVEAMADLLAWIDSLP